MSIYIFKIIFICVSTKDKDVEKKISSSSVPNGGRKGPTSGGGGWQSSLSVSPMTIPMPIPKNKKSKEKKSHRNGKARHTQKNKRIGKTQEKAEQKRPREAGVHPSALKQRRSDIIELVDSSEVVQRMRRQVDEESFSDEERKLRDEWLNFDHHENNIPSKEHVNFVPDRNRYIYETDIPYEEEGFVEQYYSSPQMKERLQKRSLEEESDDDDDVDFLNEDITSQPDDDEEDDENYQAIEKRDVSDYDLPEEKDTRLSEEDTPRYMRVRDILPEDEYSNDDITEILEDATGFSEPIRHTIVTREAPGNYGRSVRFE